MKTSRLVLASLIGLLAATTAFAKPPKVEYLNTGGKIFPSGLPFSEAVRDGNTLYLSGQIAVVPGSMKLVQGGIKEETKQIMTNIQTTLGMFGYSMNDLVKCTVMLADIGKWSDFNEIYKSYFTDHFPARSAMGVNGLALGAQVEIECMAVSTTRKK